MTEPAVWTLDAIRALRDVAGDPPAHTEGYATADPGRFEQWIRLTFEDGHQRAWISKRRGPWIEVSPRGPDRLNAEEMSSDD